MKNEYISNPDEAKEYLPRYKIFYFGIIFSFVIFFGALWYLQIIRGTELRENSEKNRLKLVNILAPRGIVLDRDGKILVENNPGFNAIVSPQYVKDIPSLAKSIAPLIGTEADKLEQKIIKSKRQNGPFAPITLKDNLSRDEVFRLKRIRLNTPGLEIRESVVRHYPLGENAAQVFGYVGEISKIQLDKMKKPIDPALQFKQGDIIGKMGIEEVLDNQLRGNDGVQFLQVDAYGRESTAQKDIFGTELSDQEPMPGYNVVLTIDKEVQQAAYDSFVKNQRTGGLFAMKTNGEVLAWISSPAFDPNEMSTEISSQSWGKLINDPFKPLRNKVIQDHYPPGSTFKPLVALAALEEKIISANTVINCPGAFSFGRRLYHDHLRGGHGNITVYEAIERSSNVFFYKMGIALGIDKMYNYISGFGIGTRSGIELPQETSGKMPSAEWKKKRYGEEWQAGENLSVAVGQGFVETNPMQMAIAYNAIGTEGKVVKPYLIKKILALDGKVLKENQPEIVRDMSELQPSGVKISNATFKIVKEAMRRVVQGDRGTAKFLRTPGFDIAGKTGTAQVMSFSADQIYASCLGRPVQQRHHGWFVAWAPAENPEITVAGLAEHSCHGSTGAGPLVRDTMIAYFKKYHPEWMQNADKNIKGSGGAITPIEGE